VPRLARSLPLLALLALLAALFVALALRRPVDHDESQYVAAALLSADGWLPYRDYAYLQTPIQPLALAPLAMVAGAWTWPAMRVASALLGALTVAATWRAMRVAGADVRAATVCAALFAACDILLFSAGTARNDALPAALFAFALSPMLRAERGAGIRGGALIAGLLLGAAAGAKISYALPAAAYGIRALVGRGHRPGWVAVGALPAVALTGGLAALAPEGFVFGTLTFPARAPAEYYAAAGRAWKLGWGAALVDTLKFLALGPALLAAAAIVRAGRSGAASGERRLLDPLILAGLVAALLPSPTWRQYLLPLLPPLFVRLAIVWSAHPPSRGWRIAAAVFAGAGLSPSVAALAAGGTLGEGLAATRALAGYRDVATLSPQLLANAPDRRFATGPFYFRSRALLSAEAERRLHLVSRDRLAILAAEPPERILVGGEGRWSSGDDALDAALERWAVASGYRVERRIGGRFRLYLRDRRAMASR